MRRQRGNLRCDLKFCPVGEAVGVSRGVLDELESRFVFRKVGEVDVEGEPAAGRGGVIDKGTESLVFVDADDQFPFASGGVADLQLEGELFAGGQWPGGLQAAGNLGREGLGDEHVWPAKQVLLKA